MANGYTLPSVRIFQEFQVALVADLPVLNAFLFGPQYDFVDLDDPEDRESAFAGLYDKTADEEKAVPGLDPAAVLVSSEVRVVFDDAELEYYSKAAGVGAFDWKPIAGKLNQVGPDPLVSGPNLKAFTNSAGTVFARDAVFGSRDVKIGDGVEVSAIIGLDTITHRTKVSDFVHDTVASTVGTATADAGNEATVAGSVGPVTPDGGNTGDDTVVAAGTYTGSLADDVLTDTYTLEVLTGGSAPTIGAATADGANTGDDTATSGGSFDSVTDDTYTVEVTTGGGSGVAEITVTSTEGDSSGPTVVTTSTAIPVGTKGVTIDFGTFGGDTVLTLGDKWTIAVTASLARMKVTSSSGTDNVAVVAFPGFGTAFDIGTRGVTASITDGGDTVLTLGDKFSFPAVKALDAVVATEAGTYTGAEDLTYTIEVVEGGLYGAAKILATSTGVDSSGPLVVTAAATPFPVGTKGVTVSFAANSQGGLMKGDKWTVAVTSEKKGAIKTLVLRETLPSEITDAGTPAVSLKLFIPQTDREVPRYREDDPLDKAWEVKTSALTGDDVVEMKSAIKLTDSTWFDTGTGDLLPLPVDTARVLIEWRALRLESSSVKGEVQPEILEIEAAVGKVHPKNPIAFSLNMAALNTVDRPLKYQTVASDDLAGFQAVLDKIKECKDVYSLVPLSQDPLVHQALDAHVGIMSTPEEARWRIGLINRALTLKEFLYDTRIDAEGDEVDYVARVIDDPDTAATDYKLLIADDGQDVNFVRDGVVPGYVVNLNFKLDLDGNTVWDEVEVEEVVSSTVLKLATDLDAPITIASKFQLFRNLSKTEQAQAHADIAESLADRRLYLVYPDVFGQGVYGDLEGYHLAAAVAGMRAALPPHQGFTNFQVQGADDLTRSFQYFTRDQLNTMAGSGVFIITQEALGTTAFVRHQLSTNTSAIEFQEMSITSNVDSISYFLQDSLDEFIGVYNVTPQTLTDIRRALEGALEELRRNPLPNIGAQIIDGTVISVEQDENFCDRVVAIVEVTIPCPLNDLTTRLRITT